MGIGLLVHILCLKTIRKLQVGYDIKLYLIKYSWPSQ